MPLRTPLVACALALLATSACTCTPTCSGFDPDCALDGLVVQQGGQELELVTVAPAQLAAHFPARSRATSVWAVGTNGTIVHFDGSAWAVVPSGRTERLRAVWGASADAVWAAGDAGLILKWDGAAWTPQASGTSAKLRGLFGTSASDVWAVGDGGVILHFDGSAWTAAASPTGHGLESVWAASATDAWAVGSAGTVVHWDGAAWTLQATPVPVAELISAVFGTGASDVWVAGTHGAAAHFDGAAWTAATSPGGEWLLSLGGSGPGDVWAVPLDAPSLRRWDGNRWAQVPPGSVSGLDSVWAASADDLFVVGAGNGHWDGHAFTKLDLPTKEVLTAVFGFAPAAPAVERPAAWATEAVPPPQLTSADARTEVAVEWTEPAGTQGCTPSFCFQVCPALLRCSGKARCTRSTQDGLVNGVWRSHLGFRVDPSGERLNVRLQTTVFVDAACAGVPAAQAPGSIPPGLGPMLEFDLVRAAGGAGGGGGSACTGGWVGSTRSYGAVGASDPCAASGVLSTCLTDADYQAATGQPLPAACAPEGTTDCLSPTGGLQKPCCEGLTCVYRTQCGAPASATGGQCMKL